MGSGLQMWHYVAMVSMIEVVCNGMPVNMELMRHLVSDPTSAGSGVGRMLDAETGSGCRTWGLNGAKMDGFC